MMRRPLIFQIIARSENLFRSFSLALCSNRKKEPRYVPEVSSSELTLEFGRHARY